MKRIYYHKLIRDKIPDRIKAAGAEAKYKKLNRTEYVRELIRKVEEEASGMQKAKSTKDITAEIADVLDVIDEVKKVFHITSSQITKAQRANFKRKGGFTKRLYLVWSSDDGYKTNEKRRDRKGRLKR